MPTFKISRRTVLRGTLGGAAVSFGLPPLEAMFNANGTALAQGGALPKRLGIFAWGGGIKRDRWIPTATGATWDLSPELAPFANVKDYINIVTGLAVKTGNPQGHHAGWGGIFSGSSLIVQPKGSAPFRSTFGTKSVDQFAADSIGKETKYKSLEVGISSGLNGAEGTTLKYLSHNGPDLPISAIYEPGAFFDRVFGTGFTAPSTPAMPVVDPTKGLRRSVMDAVQADLTSLRVRLSTSDKLRLDQHLENVRNIEKRLAMDTVLPAACKLPTKPGAIADSRGHELLEERVKAMSDLMAVALACDQTRVFSMLFSGSTASTVYWQVGVSEGHHGLTHDEGGNQPQVHATIVYTMKLFAYLLEALKNIPEGAGNVLDNCAIYGSSDLSDGKAHDLIDYPMVIAGGGGGYLKKPGWHYRSMTGAGTMNGENANNAILTVLRAAGVTDAAGGPLKQFGGGSAMTTTSITAIEK
ncbi:MAG TPA: DUF1552 domain-containing protein [Polyangia bacterium]|nr:DUF1552 domain-containing protein [Polyangia bacterium]